MVLCILPVPGRPTIWMVVGQGPTALAVGARGGCLDIFIPRHTLVAGYYVLTLAVRVSVRLSVRSPYVRPSALRFRSIT